jgi:hypothetical protein
MVCTFCATLHLRWIPHGDAHPARRALSVDPSRLMLEE